MTSSGTYTYQLSNGESVLAAFERVRVRAPSLRQGHFVTARRELNMLFVEWANKQVNLWKVEQYTVPLVAGQAVYDVLPRTVMILDAWVTVGTGQFSQDLTIVPISRTDYANFTNKQTQGRPTAFWFDRLIAPSVTVWPVPDAGGGPYTMSWYACVQMQDANVPGGETPDVPYLWLDALVAGLAHRLARVYAPDLEIVRKADAKEAWETAATQNTENVGLTLALNLGGYYR
jgi:hypothetical protein